MKIVSLHNSNGEKLEEHGDIEKELRDYYNQFLSDPEIERQGAMISILSHILRLVILE
jgi:hypothetical protein